MATTKCPGGTWQLGTGNPICPVCHRGWRSILGTRDRKRQPERGTPVPVHTPYP